jgi:hypothetical protein
MSKNRVLFILKRKEDYHAVVDSHIGLSTGLYNSANFMNEMLQKSGVESKLVVVIDNNCIDREVTQFKPTHVIIEALWVVPTKFSVLCKLHPNVKWVIRLHSEVPFLANEGIAFDWIADYARFKNIVIAANAPRALKEVRMYVKRALDLTKTEVEDKIIYLPNFYPQKYKRKKLDKRKDTIDIGCFGAVRPLKNHMLQAIAAVKFADKIGKKLNFHINAGRIEMKGEPVLHNLKGFFTQLYPTGHRLVSHHWKHRDEFLEVCASMDMGMQCSFSETFNIVGADLISQGVPLVGSTEIPWIDSTWCANPVEVDEIYDALLQSYNIYKLNVFFNQWYLKRYTSKTRRIWKKYFKQ